MKFCVSLSVLALLVLSACSGGAPPPGTPTDIPDIRLENIHTEYVDYTTNIVSVENCNGTDPVKQTINRTESTTTETELQVSAEVSASIKTVVEVKIQAQFGIKNGETKEFSQNFEVTVAPKSSVGYEIKWVETWRVGDVVIDSLKLRFPFRARTSLEGRIGTGSPQTCSGAMTPAPPTITQTNTPQAADTATNTPTSLHPITNSTFPTHPPTETSTSSPTLTMTISPTDTLIPTNIPTALPVPTMTSTNTPVAGSAFSPTIQTVNGVDFSLVPDGTFSDSWGSANEAFYIGVYEITYAQFAVFLNGRNNRNNLSSDGQRLFDNNLSDIKIHYVQAQWQVDNGYENYPAANVTWYGARDYCAWIGGRLPSASEWHKAAAWNPTTGQATIYPWGNALPSPTVANFNNVSKGTAVIGSYPAGRSVIGAYDMSGNVWEWVSNPIGVNRPIMGGAWDSDPLKIRSDSFDTATATFSRQNIGLRCAKDS